MQIVMEVQALRSKTTQSKNRRAPRSTAPKKPYAERNGALMTYEEVADELAINKRMVRNLVERGDLVRLKCGNLNRIPRTSVDEFLASGS